MSITTLSADSAWAIATEYIAKNGKFQSVTGIIYQTKVETNRILYIEEGNGTKVSLKTLKKMILLQLSR